MAKCVVCGKMFAAKVTTVEGCPECPECKKRAETIIDAVFERQIAPIICALRKRVSLVK
jgi:predicted  nucleic acid-binding Zn-ribbon protein